MASISALGIGSGLDLNGLLDQLNSAERGKLAPITQQKKAVQARISAYGRMQSALASFRDAATKLADPAHFRQVSSTVSGSAVTATASVDAVAGVYDVEVTHLARAQSLATAGFATSDTDLGAGTLTIDVGEGGSAQTLDIALTANSSSLADIRDAINAKNAGVTASLVNDGSAEPWRLVLSTTATGTAAAVNVVTFAHDGDDVALETKFAFDAATYDPLNPPAGAASETVVARNASFKVNGVGITSGSNRVENAIQGVTLSLAEEGTSTVTVSRNEKGVKDGVDNFVKAYNSLHSALRDLSSYDAESGSAGILLGDSTLRSVQSQLRREITAMGGAGDVRMLSDLGIRVQLDGSLKAEGTTLADKIAADPASVSAFFAGTEADASTGLAARLEARIKPMLDSGGLFDNATKAQKAQAKSLDQRYTRMEASIETTIARYREQFSQLDSMVASMNQTSGYLTQQFENLSALFDHSKK
ncbi:flagellar filament capping protein FliD [Thauera aromatica]|uniref:flagellar filament capping protein FliD n=1 Tax=Thauera aromatica TaxID=59405 RepID=UPI001FFD88F6|nr:flagellar filament capping protein FliD [Thauera aromatica]MCK2087641.1 flagellar filament capping protein FliD [Thauera aromatica]